MSKPRRYPAHRRPAPGLLPPALARKRSAGEVEEPPAVVPSTTPASTGGGLAALLEQLTAGMLAATYWFEPDPHPEPYAVLVRFTGRRVDVQGPLQPGDQFVHDETIEQVAPGSGPISLTAKVRGIPPGEWAVTARVLGSAHPPARAPREPGSAPPASSRSGPVVRLWRRWAPSVESVKAVHTSLLPLARVPGIVPGIWGALVTLGMVVALALQFLVIALAHLALGSAWLITLVGIAVGIVGAKVWFMVLYRRAHRFEGWCIQGFITGAILAATLMLVVLHVSAGVFLDATAPGLLVAMAIGRVGCFFAGCCGGPLTASHWGVWSSDQRVGARRIPTQLLESALALSMGLLALLAILVHGPAGGAFFVGALAGYTLGRQGILRLRAERSKKWLEVVITVALAVLVLVVNLGSFAR